MTQPFELLADPQGDAIRAFHARQAGIWTALPGIVQSFDATAMTCVVQPAIQAVVFGPDGTARDVSLPLLLDCPVMFPGGGGCTLTFPVQAGDECLVVFASRCIDAWWYAGGVQPQAEMRMHDLSDGFALVGVRSQPRVLSGISTTAAQLRTDDGSTFVEVGPGECTVTAPDKITLNAPTVTINASTATQINTPTATISGALVVQGGISVSGGTGANITGDLSTTGDVKAGSISLTDHTHTDPQGGSTGPAQ